MGWPLPQDYNEAIQSPAVNFADRDLRAGQVSVNPLGIPLPRSGNFADVYEVRGPGGGRWAVKCFTREVPGLRARYRAISNHLRRAQLPFTVDFTFLDRGIRVRGRWYPVLKMQWVEGLTLNDFARQYADKPAMLEALLRIWVRMAGRLRAAGIAHGDLQHGNVLLVPTGASSLAAKLIDYDGLFVPALARRPSGEVGHPCYQHPQRLRQRVYGPEVDRFPFLLIATALGCLQAGGRALWERYDSGDNLLFREADLQAPVKSRLFYELLKLGEPRARRLVEQTLEALRSDLSQAPLLEEVLPELQPPPPAQAMPMRALRPTSRPAGAEAYAGPIVRMPRVPHNRGRSAAAVVLAAALLALLGVSLVWSYATRSPTTPAAGNAAARKDSPAQKPKGKPAAEESEAAAPRVEPKPVDAPARLPEKPAPARPAPPAPRRGDVMQNTVGMKLVYVPEGTFRMGASFAQIEAYKKLPNRGYSPDGGIPEFPQHEVHITRGFYLGAHEVTQGEYEKVMGTNPSEFKVSPSHPVERVSWGDAVAFCQKLSELPAEKEAGRTYRLPTEAEWEYACRAGTTTAFHYGDSLAFGQANFGSKEPFGGPDVPKQDPIGKTVKVGSYAPNAWGLYDMHGNVWEWCLDGAREYTKEPADDPRGPEGGADRVMRGGSWRDGAVRSAYRKARPPSIYRVNVCGFRVLCRR